MTLPLSSPSKCSRFSACAPMLADQCARGRERVVFADQAYSIRTAVFSGKGNITWNVHVCRAKRNTWNWLLKGTRALVLLYVRQIIFLKPSNPASTMRADSNPIAQSAEFLILTAVCSISSNVSIVAVLFKTLSKSSSKMPSPMRHGTHFPQVCAWQNYPFSLLFDWILTVRPAKIRCRMIKNYYSNNFLLYCI